MRLFLKQAAISCVGVSLAGCGGSPAEFMREPRMSAVGSGIYSTNLEYSARAIAMGANPQPGVFPSRAANLYSDKRVANVGDIITVNISINDKATFGNSTDRSQSAKASTAIDWAWQFISPSSSSSSTSSSSTPSTIKTDVTSTSSTQGQGNIDRSEQIQVSIAAVVTDVLPNGNLIISGSQEVRVNYELRQLTVGGIVRPSDISRNNSIGYDHIAEARISYGGRGRLSEVQQPSWGQQIYDSVKPF